MKSNTIIFIGIMMVIAGAVLSLMPTERLGHYKHDKKHNVVIRFNGEDSQIPKDGQLMVVKCSLEDTVVVEPATDDDCRRILEEHGKG